MSTEVAADPSADAPDLTGAPRRGRWTRDLRSARVLRFALGVTAAVVIAFAYEWPLSGVLAVLFAILAHGLFPDPPGGRTDYRPRPPAGFFYAKNTRQDGNTTH